MRAAGSYWRDCFTFFAEAAEQGSKGAFGP